MTGDYGSTQIIRYKYICDRKNDSDRLTNDHANHEYKILYLATEEDEGESTPKKSIGATNSNYMYIFYHIHI